MSRPRLCIYRTAPIRFSRWSEQHRHTLFVLEKLAEHRNRFTTVTLLTKNPAVLMDDRYVQVLHRLNELPPDHPRRPWFDEQGHPPLRVECSLAFFNDEHRRLLDPAAPSVESRMEALRFLRKEGLPVFLRIDPLFPRDPLGGGKTMADFGLPDVQSMRDLEGLVSFGRELAAGHIIYSVAKITRPKQGDLPPVMERMKRVYQHLSGSAAARLSRRFLAAAGKRRHGTRAEAVLGSVQPAFDSRQTLQDESDYDALSSSLPAANRYIAMLMSITMCQHFEHNRTGSSRTSPCVTTTRYRRPTTETVLDVRIRRSYTNWFNSGRLLDFIAGPSHSTRLPTPARIARLPNSTISVSGPAWSKLENAGRPPLHAVTHSPK